jgi:hypothetical protein
MPLAPKGLLGAFSLLFPALLHLLSLLVSSFNALAWSGIPALQSLRTASCPSGDLQVFLGLTEVLNLTCVRHLGTEPLGAPQASHGLSLQKATLPVAAVWALIDMVSPTGLLL